MISRIQLSTLLAIAVVLWGVFLIIGGVAVSVSWLKPFTTVSGILVILLTIFDRWAWRLPVLYPWFVSIPNLNGTWKGELLSSWTDPETKEIEPPIEVFLVVRQTYSTILLRLISKESQSDLLAGKIFQGLGKTHLIAGVYQNVPNIQRRDTSPTHYGGMLLHVHGDSTFVLEGEYWTDRLTKGALNFKAKSKKVTYNYEQAVSASYKKQKL